MKTQRRRRLLNAALPLGLVLLAGAAHAADLWHTAPGAQSGSAVQLDRGVLDELAKGSGERVTVTAGGVGHEVLMTSTAPNAQGVRSYRGEVPGSPGSFLLLTTGPGDAAAALYEPVAGERWRLHGSAGKLLLEPIDAEDFAPCAGALPPPADLPVPDDSRHAAPPGNNGARAFGDAADDGSRLDLLVAWTPETENAAGGAAQMEAEIQLAVDAANMVYANSGVAARLRLVHTARTEYDESSAWNYEDHVIALANPQDGIMDEVPQLRTIVGADFMVLFVESTDALGNPIGACGVGYVMGPEIFTPEFEILAASTVSRHCASSVWTLAHELGHNRGCAHNREDATVDGLTSYAYGHRFTGDDGQGYRTVMSYDTDPASMTRIPFFANPSLTYAGTPVGVPIGTPGESHTAQVQNISDTLCAGFRPERTFVDFDWSGGSTGLVDAPFANLADGLAHARSGGQVVLRNDAPRYTATLEDPSVLLVLGAVPSVLGAP